MTLPTIHMNGTSPADLCEGYCEAMRAVSKAAEVIAEHGPNGRDYYPKGPDALTAAVAEHRARLKALKTVHQELEYLAMHCAEERDKRARK